MAPAVTQTWEHGIINPKDYTQRHTQQKALANNLVGVKIKRGPGQILIQDLEIKGLTCYFEKNYR